MIPFILRNHFSILTKSQVVLKSLETQEAYRLFLQNHQFPEYYKYMRALARDQEHDQLISTYRRLSIFKKLQFRSYPDNQVVKSWIYDAYLQTQGKDNIKTPHITKLAYFLTLIVMPLYFIFEPKITLEFNYTTSEEDETEKQKVKFQDVIGIDDYKEELQEIVDFLKNPGKYHQSGAKLPKGILLVGRPGTGKTLLARALANEAQCTFLYKSGSEFEEKFVGVGARRVKDLFQKARESQPALIFIDEIDSIGGSRSAAQSGQQRAVINQILTEMDGFKQGDSIIVIGATNLEKSLDKALTRAGRFDKVIHIMPPDVRGREKLFEYYLAKIKHEAIDTKLLAKQTAGMTGAEIENIINLAIMNAIKHNQTHARPEDFQLSIDRVLMGVRYKITDQDKELTAYHESGHALTCLLTKASVPLHKVTILPRGGALGYTSMVEEEDKLSQTRANIIAQIDVAMGGRAAEEIRYGIDNLTSGCGGDLARATELAYAYVTQLGMGDDLIADGKTSRRYDFQTDMQVKSILEQSYNRVKQLLIENREALNRFAAYLIEHETVKADELRKLM